MTDMPMVGAAHGRGTACSTGADFPGIKPIPQVLTPYSKAEALSLKEAAFISGRSIVTVKKWAALNHLGRVVGGSRWEVSRPALQMWLDGDKAALKRYLAGDRESPQVAHYFAVTGVPLPHKADRQAPSTCGGSR